MELLVVTVVVVLIVLVTLSGRAESAEKKAQLERDRINFENRNLISQRKWEDEERRKKQADISAANAKKEALEKAHLEELKELECAVDELTRLLPFYISDNTIADEYLTQNQKSWAEVIKHIQEEDSKITYLYFVKIRSLLDENEYFKIGITTKSIEERFEKSTQVELIEVLATFETKLYIASFLEYHFLKEFRILDSLSETLDESKPVARFSGYTEVVRANSESKITGFFKKLDVYNQP